jgi:hypothetical protein
MKKYLSLIAVTLALTACNTNSSNQGTGEFDRTSLSIITPTGAPALAFYNYSGSERFETNSNPAEGIIPQMVTGQKDVVVLPTNAGMQAILNKKAEYQIAATITFGNFYLISMNNDANKTLDADDTILLFQKGNVPDKVFHYVYGDNYNSNIHYVSAVSDAAAAVNAGFFADAETGNNIVPNYVMLAQPVLTTVLNKNADKGYAVYADMQAKYKEKSNNQALFQASVFVKKSLDRKVVTSFLDSLKADIDAAIKNPEVIQEALKDAQDAQTVYGIAPAMATTVTKNNNGMGLGFERAINNKEAVETFLKLFGIEGFDEEVYF